MAKTTMSFGAALIAIGVIGYVVGGMSSVTGLIPAFFGLALAGLGWWAGKGHEKTALHIATVVGIVGAVAPLSRIVPGLAGGGELGLAFWTNVLMFVVCGAFVALCAKSFMVARKARAAMAK